MILVATDPAQARVEFSPSVGRSEENWLYFSSSADYVLVVIVPPPRSIVRSCLGGRLLRRRDVGQVIGRKARRGVLSPRARERCDGIGTRIPGPVLGEPCLVVGLAATPPWPGTALGDENWTAAPSLARDIAVEPLAGDTMHWEACGRPAPTLRKGLYSRCYQTHWRDAASGPACEVCELADPRVLVRRRMPDATSAPHWQTLCANCDAVAGHRQLDLGELRAEVRPARVTNCSGG